MSSRTSAIRGLAFVALAALGFAACESKSTAVNTVINPPATLAVTPAGPINLNVGGTATLAISTSNFGAAPTVTCTDQAGDTAVTATAGAGSCAIVAKKPGSTTVTVKAVGTDLDGRAQTLVQAVQVIVAGGQTSGPGQATITIQAITNSIGQNVDVTNAFGQVNVVLNVDNGATATTAGVKLDSIVVKVDGQVACTQKLTSGSSAGIGTESAEALQTVVCSINTAAVNAAGVPNLFNGTHVISASLFSGTTAVATAADFPITLNNTNFVAVSFTKADGTALNCATSGAATTLAPVGSSWCAGAVTARILPSIYTPGGNTGSNGLQNVTIALSTLGAGVNGNPGCVPTFNAGTDPTVAPADRVPAGVGTTPNCGIATATQNATLTGGVWIATFPVTANMAAGGVMGVEDVTTATVTSVNNAGQAGPTCINPDPASNPQNPTITPFGTFVTCGNGLGLGQNGQPLSPNPLRLDNLAPRITNLDIVPTGQLACAPDAACYVNSGAKLVAGFKAVDYGVDAATSTFAFGAPGAVTNALDTTGALFASNFETATSQTDVLAATVTDKLGNASTRYASTTKSITVSSGASATVQKFGVDVTAPTCGFVNSPNASYVLAGEIFNISNAGTVPANFFGDTFIDSATPPAGPSGFPVNPLVRSEVRAAPAGNTCVIGSATCAAVDGSVVAYGAAPTPAAQLADVLNAGSAAVATNGYVTYTGTVHDVAGNTCALGTRTALVDTQAPTVGAVIVTPSIIPASTAGQNSVTFSAQANDNIDLGNVTAFENYGVADLTNLQAGSTVLGTFGSDVFSTSANASFTDTQFIRSIETTTGAGTPTGAITNAQSVSLTVTDVAGNVTPSSPPPGNLSVAVGAGPAIASFGDTFAGGAGSSFNFTSSANPVCNDSNGDGVCVPPTSTTLKATATGTATTFNNPFSFVNFYYVDASGTTHLIGQGTVGVTDNTITNIRTWSYTTTWAPRLRWCLATTMCSRLASARVAAA